MSALDIDYDELLHGAMVLPKQRQIELVEALRLLRHERQKEDATFTSLRDAVTRIVESVDRTGK